GIKHLNRLEQVLAAAQAAEAGAAEAVLLNQSGELVSVSSGNIFLLCDGVLLTPPLDACGIAGTRRRLILQQLAPACGLEVRETRLTTRQLEQCDEAFYSNSLVGLRPVGRFGERSWDSHPVCQALFEQYRGTLS
ncbi:MAG: aminotransferase class IV, partial [Halieaceae bacterium]|nr:aminotransferase class IV [Halieaceae bacterium]